MASSIDESTIEYQQSAWERFKKNINCQLNNVNTSNLSLIIRELFHNNIIRSCGLFAHRIIRVQIASPFYTPVYAALVSVINTMLSKIGELTAKYLISSFRRTYQENDKTNCLATTTFIGHFVNQNILHNMLALGMLVFLLENPTDNSVELEIEFLKMCGKKLSQVSPHGLDSVFSTLKKLLHQSTLNKHTQFMIEALFAIGKDQFKANPIIQLGLALVDENVQFTHMMTLDDLCESGPMFNIFQYDDQYEENEKEYEKIRRKILVHSSHDKEGNEKKEEQGSDIA
ncbi:unnamed protein product [Rotaria sp. Silwood1]|nr:unnamed protein product [Rotaria sp. Silwood1]